MVVQSLKEKSIDFVSFLYDLLTTRVMKMEFDVGENVSLQHFFNDRLPNLAGHTFDYLLYFKKEQNRVELHLSCAFDTLRAYLVLANHFCNDDIKLVSVSDLI